MGKRMQNLQFELDKIMSGHNYNICEYIARTCVAYRIIKSICFFQFICVNFFPSIYGYGRSSWDE